ASCPPPRPPRAARPGAPRKGARRGVGASDRPARRDETGRIQRHITASASIGIDVGLVRRLVGREPDVPVGAREPRRTELRLQVGEESDHRPLYLFVVLSAVSLEVSFRVVSPKPEEVALEVP